MARDSGLYLLEHCDCRTDLARRAVAALEAIVLHESRLHRMKLLWRAEPFDGRDFVALVHHRERQAGDDPPPTDQDRACAALPLIAPFFAACEMQMLPQRIE